MVPPGLIRPARSASSIIARPTRSLTEPAGLRNSSLAYTSAATLFPRTLFRRTMGVLPTAPKTFSTGFGGPCRSTAVFCAVFISTPLQIRKTRRKDLGLYRLTRTPAPVENLFIIKVDYIVYLMGSYMGLEAA